MVYSQRDYAEMHYYYGYAQGNAGLAARLYRDMLIRRGGRQPATYPDRHVFRSYLNDRFPERWIGRSGPIAWPPRSPDLNPIDFFIWGYYKELVYHSEFSTLQQLKSKLSEAAEKIQQKTQVFQDLRINFLRRCRLCIEAGGGHFEHLI